MLWRWITVCLLLGLASCQSARQESTSASHRQEQAHAIPIRIEQGEQIVRAIQVNGEALTIEEILKPIQPKLKELAGAHSLEGFINYAMQEVTNEIVRQVHELLIYQEASRGLTEQTLEAVDRYVDQEIRERINRNYAGRQSRFEQELARQGLTLRDVGEEIKREVIVSKYLQDRILHKVANPTRRRLLKIYDENIDEFIQPGSRELNLIDIPKGNDPVEAHTQIVQAKSSLDEGAPFEEVARSYSRGIHASDGGFWGAVRTELGNRYAAVSEVFFELSEAQISEIIETEDAYFIVKAGRIEPGSKRSFEEVQPELIERYRAIQLQTERIDLIQSLVDQAVFEPDEQTFFQSIRGVLQKEYPELAQPG